MKKIFLVLFSLILMCSVSFGIEINKGYTIRQEAYGSTSVAYILSGYNSTQICDILNNYNNAPDVESYKTAFDELLEACYSYEGSFAMFSTSNGYILYLSASYGLGSFEEYGLCMLDNGTDTYLCNVWTGSNYATLYPTRGYYSNSSSGKALYHKHVPLNSTVYASNLMIPLLEYDGSSYKWDGESYAYNPNESNGSEFPDFTDEQIAEIVERFINSDAYLENAYYNGDYFITYDNLTGYFRGYSYSWNIDLAIEYGNYNEEGEFITTGTKEGEAWRIRPYEFSGDIFTKFGDWLASKFNTYSFEYFSISLDSSIEPRYIGKLEHNYCSNYVENEVVIYSSKQIRYVGEETNSEGKTETVVTDNYIPPTVLVDSETGEQIVIRDNLQNSSDNLENIITPNADFSGLKQAFEKYISFVNISSITWLTTAISSMIAIFVPFVALGIIIFLINRILNGGS